MPTLEKLYRLDPESNPFRQPVDPTNLGIPDYFDIVKRPMDLSTIKRKLDTGMYQDPWEYVDDVWLMFDNAWLYNRKTSKVYRYCTKVSKYFNKNWPIYLKIIDICSYLRCLSKRLILWCKVWDTAVAESIPSIRKCSAVMESNCVPSLEMPSISATKAGKAFFEFYIYFQHYASSPQLTALNLLLVVIFFFYHYSEFRFIRPLYVTRTSNLKKSP